MNPFTLDPTTGETRPRARLHSRLLTPCLASPPPSAAAPAVPHPRTHTHCKTLRAAADADPAAQPFPLDIRMELDDTAAFRWGLGGGDAARAGPPGAAAALPCLPCERLCANPAPPADRTHPPTNPPHPPTHPPRNSAKWGDVEFPLPFGRVLTKAELSGGAPAGGRGAPPGGGGGRFAAAGARQAAPGAASSCRLEGAGGEGSFPLSLAGSRAAGAPQRPASRAAPWRPRELHAPSSPAPQARASSSRCSTPRAACGSWSRAAARRSSTQTPSATWASRRCARGGGGRFLHARGAAAEGAAAQGPAPARSPARRRRVAPCQRSPS
jgi:hypothetical protein